MKTNKCALILLVHFCYSMVTNMLQPLSGHLQDDLFESKSTVIIKMCLNYSTVLNPI